MTALIVTMMLMAANACSELTSVDTSDVVEPGSLENTVGAEALRAGAITLFTNGFAGDFGRNQITISGMMADELFATNTNEELDKRNIDDDVFGWLDRQLQPARVNALLAIEALQKVAPEPAWKIGELFALVAYTEVLFAENLCSGVPLSAIVNGEPSFGTPLNTVEMLERAVADFDLALGSSGDNEEISNLARVGRGRALLNLARFDEAATAVTSVPTEFSYATEHSATVQPNGVFRTLNTNLLATVSDSEGMNGLDFRSADPRVRTKLVGEGFDGTPVFALTDRFTSDASPSVLASGIEARLIEAEARLQAGDAAGALQKLNELRSTRSDLPPLEQQPTETARVDQLFRERAFWLFLTGHRHGDLRRLIRQYGRQTESVFPTGFYKPGFEYGADVTLLPDRTEQENPNFDGCFNREA